MDETYNWLNNIYTIQGNTETVQALLTGITRFLTYSYAALRVLTEQYGTRITLGDSLLSLALQSLLQIPSAVLL